MNDLTRGVSAILVAFVAATACDSPTETVPAGATRPDARAWVAGEAVDALDSSGRFIMPALSAPGGTSIVSLETAGELAVAVIRNHLYQGTTLPDTESIIDFMERTHGAPIAWDATQLADPVGYGAESPYAPASNSVALSIRRRIAAQYLIALWVREHQVVSVAVSALTTDFDVNERGFLVPPEGSQAGTFFFLGVDSGISTHHPLHPEEAVRDVGLLAGAKVVEVPVLVTPTIGVSAHGSKWRLALDRDVELETADGIQIRSTQVYVASNPSGGPIHWFVPTADQPTEQVVEDAGGREITLRLREGIPSQFVRIKRPAD